MSMPIASPFWTHSQPVNMSEFPVFWQKVSDEITALLNNGTDFLVPQLILGSSYGSSTGNFEARLELTRAIPLDIQTGAPAGFHKFSAWADIKGQFEMFLDIWRRFSAINDPTFVSTPRKEADALYAFMTSEVRMTFTEQLKIGEPDAPVYFSKPLGAFSLLRPQVYDATTRQELVKIFVSFRLRMGTGLRHAIFSKVTNRRIRKWGRTLTPRWELEHAAIMRGRKFARNQKKIEDDNMKLRKRRTAKSRKRRAEKKRRDRRKLLAVPKVCKPPVKYKVRRRSKRKK